MYKMKLSFLCSIMFFNAHGAYAEGVDVAGHWLTEGKEAYVEVKDCGDGTPCGYLRLIDPDFIENALDTENPDAVRREQPLHGVKMLWGFTRKGEVGSKSWKGGKIYDPNSGKTYRSTVSLTDQDVLIVKGCVGPFCQGQNWTRYSGAKDTK